MKNTLDNSAHDTTARVQKLGGEPLGYPSPKWPAIVISLVSTLALAFLFYLIYGRESSGEHADAVLFLPALNAACNATTSVLIVLGLRAIFAKKPDLHRRLMLSAFATSTLFLVGYIVYHSVHGDTKFPLGHGWVRPAYLTLLASHILLSMIALPMVLGTFWLALSGDLVRHRRLARWTYPIWLYVSVTGVIIFLVLKAYT
jgi:putative membrane protein